MGCDWDGARAELLGVETGFCFVLLFLICEVVTILCSLGENALGWTLMIYAVFYMYVILQFRCLF